MPSSYGFALACPIGKPEREIMACVGIIEYKVTKFNRNSSMVAARKYSKGVIF